ncbi:MADS-box protein EJ2 [Vitis vinifera]|uniref:MADS-box protein EJ2 n=1 Tax=Vitis vinifera TaxID=29760 RepID=A0A438J0X5_VITVI|nr:MADS-box protein EJ2 [Vitis vinifera]
MLDQLSDLQRKEQILMEANNALRRKENLNPSAFSSGLEFLQLSNLMQKVAWDQHGKLPHIIYHIIAKPVQSEDFFEPLQCDSTLQIGYNPVLRVEMNGASTTQNVNGFIPGWMV